jgi:hypothetical protein
MLLLNHPEPAPFCDVQIQPVQQTASAAASGALSVQQQLQAVTSSSSSTVSQQQQQEKAAAAPKLHAVYQYEPPNRPEAALPVSRRMQASSNAARISAASVASDKQSTTAAYADAPSSSGTRLAPKSSESHGNGLRLGSKDASSSSSTARRRQLKQTTLQEQQQPDAGIWHVDVLVVVSPAAAASGGGLDAAAVAAALAVAKANKAYVDSQVGVRLNLVAVRQVGCATSVYFIDIIVLSLKLKHQCDWPRVPQEHPELRVQQWVQTSMLSMV